MRSRPAMSAPSRAVLFSAAALLFTLHPFGAAQGQAGPGAACVSAAGPEVGSVHHLDAWPDGRALVSSANGLFLASVREGQVSVARAGDAGIGRALVSHRLADGALVATLKGLHFARVSAGAVETSAVAADTGLVLAFRELPGAGLLAGGENGAFLVREAKGGVAVAPLETDTGRVFEMHEFPAGGVLIAAEKGWFLARAVDGKAVLAPAGRADTGYAHSTKALAGIGLRIESQAGWFLVRESGGAVTIGPFGDAATGHVGAVGDFPGGGMLLHTQNGWFLAQHAEGSLAFKRVDGPEVERVFRMIALRDGVLVYSKDGWFLAREANGAITFTPAGPFDQAQFVQQVHELPGGAVLVGDAMRGLFVIRASERRPMLARAGETDTGYVSMIRGMTGGTVLVGTRKGFFTARDEAGKIVLTPASDGEVDTGRLLQQPRYPLFASTELADGTVLIGAERGLFAAVPRACPAR